MSDRVGPTVDRLSGPKKTRSESVAAMTFREGSETTADVNHLTVFTAPESKGKPAGGLVAAEPDDSNLESVEVEETPSFSEELLQASPSPSEDPVRLYLKEIGKVPLLKAQEEVAIGQRIEVGQIGLRRDLGGIPLAV